MAENWKPVVGYELLYEVSDLGNVRSLDRQLGDGSRRAGRTLRPGRHTGGYALVALSRGGEERTRYVHRLVAEAWIGPQPDGQEVCHQDGDPWHNAASNLRWDTHSANMADQVRHGTNVRAQKTHCPQGHALTAPNLRVSQLRRGLRSCRACQIGRVRASKRGVQFSFGDADDIYRRFMSGTDQSGASASLAI